MTQLQLWIDRFQEGDPEAPGELLNCAGEQLRWLVRRMLRDYARVRRWEETDDVLQNALVRLWRTFQRTAPSSVQGFFSLAGREIRRELIDLARHYFGPEGLGANHASRPEWNDSSDIPCPGFPKAEGTFDPGR